MQKILLTRNDAKLKQDRVGGESGGRSQKCDSSQGKQHPLQILASLLVVRYDAVMHVRNVWLVVNVRHVRYMRMRKVVLVLLLWEVHLLLSAENTPGKLVMLLPRDPGCEVIGFFTQKKSIGV